MEIKILKDEKNELEISIDNQTLAELLRVYTSEEGGVDLAVWKREHPSKPIHLVVKTSGKSPKKALQDAISKIEKDTSNLLSEFKKAK